MTPDFTNLKLLRDLARRAAAAAKRVEAEGDNLRAARIHADAIRFGVHLGRCPDSLYAMTGWATLGLNAARMRQFLAHKPGEAPLRLLMEEFASMDHRPFAFSPMTEHYAGRIQTSLLRKQPLTDETLAEAIGYLRNPREPFDGFGPDMLREDWLKYLQRLPLEERERVYRRWADQVGDETRALARAGEGTFTESRPRVLAQVEKMRKLATVEEGKATAENPLMPAVLSQEILHPRAAIDNAALAMSRILCAAALHQAQTGNYPDSLEPLRQYFPEGLPTDPFTEQDFIYSLEDGLPAARCNPPDEVRTPYSIDPFRMSLADSLKQEAHALESYRAEQK